VCKLYPKTFCLIVSALFCRISILKMFKVIFDLQRFISRFHYKVFSDRSQEAMIDQVGLLFMFQITTPNFFMFELLSNSYEWKLLFHQAFWSFPLAYLAQFPKLAHFSIVTVFLIFHFKRIIMIKTFSDFDMIFFELVIEEGKSQIQRILH
jgi:hypothetical protein